MSKSIRNHLQLSANYYYLGISKSHLFLFQITFILCTYLYLVFQIYLDNNFYHYLFLEYLLYISHRHGQVILLYIQITI